MNAIKERDFFEVMTSDHKLKESREGSNKVLLTVLNVQPDLPT